MDYMVALRYRQRELLDLSKEIWDYLQFKQIMITAEYLLSHLNIEADNSKKKSKWKLPPALFHMICQKWGTLIIDLFATWMPHQIPVYMAWKLEPGSRATTAMQKS